MLNQIRQNARVQPFFCCFSTKKNCIFIIPEQPRYSFKNKKNIQTKNRILIFLLPNLSMLHLLQVTDVNIDTHRHRNNIMPGQWNICITHINKQLSTKNQTHRRYYPMGFTPETIGSQSSSHRVLEFQPQGVGVPAIGCGTPKTQVLQTLKPGSYRLRNLGLGALKGGSYRTEIWGIRLWRYT